MVWPHLKILWHDDEHYEGGRQRSRNMKTEEMGRQHHRMDRDGVWRFAEGSGRQGKVERYSCFVIFGALTTAKVKGLR